MKRKDKNEILDRAVAEIRDDTPAPAVLREAAGRVWGRLRAEESASVPDEASAGRIEGCAGIRALVPAYLAGSLPEARVLLLEDHARECVPCRKAIREARTERPERRAALARERGPAIRWAVAASLIFVSLVGAGVWIRERILSDPALAAVSVDSVDGALYRVAGAGIAEVGPGVRIESGEPLRTAKGSHAVVRLADGSRVELDERSEFRVSANGRATTLHLVRGNIIVEAAKQGSRRHLAVATSDCVVSVTGTVFAVSHGAKGSRVSVIEGEVRVERSGDASVLAPGDQISTRPTLEAVPLAREIAWSRDLDRHLAVLEELTRLRKDMEAALPHPRTRYTARFLALVPSNTIVYAGLPNLGSTIDEAHRLLKERIAQSAVLRRWWDEEMAPAQVDSQIDDIVRKIRAFGDRFGEEIVLAILAGEGGKFGGLLAMAELARPGEFRAFLEDEIRRMDASAGRSILRIVDDLRAAAPPAGAEGQPPLLLWARGDVFAASTSLEPLRALDAALERGGASPFRATPFHASLEAAYREGAAWILGVDLERIFRDASLQVGNDRKALERLGLLDLRHFILEAKEEGDKTLHRGVLTFDGARRGIASWLAAPAPMGSLQFVSPDASLAAAFVAKNPRSLVEDFLGFLEASDPDLNRRLAECEARHGLDLLARLAAPLGGEFAFALDGPVLPKPSWKLVVEVYDPSGLQQSIETAIDEINRSEGSAEPIFTLTRDESGGRVHHTLRAKVPGGEVHYTFVDGYLVAAPARSLVDAAIAIRRAGAALPESARFTGLLPRDGHVHFSAVVYQNLAPVLGPIAGRLGDAAADLTPEQRAAIERLLDDAPPSLGYAYGEPDRIVFAGARPGGILGPNLDALLGLGGLMRIQRSVEAAVGGPAGRDAIAGPPER